MIHFPLDGLIVLKKGLLLYADAMEAVGYRWRGAAAAAAAVFAVVLATIAGPLGWRLRCRALADRVRELEAKLKASVEKGAAERRGRIKVQQALRKALAHEQDTSSSSSSYPMTPIAVVRSCFSTRNGTPRQPLLVPLARACLTLDTSRVPPSALEGLAEYSHCWVLYVFHLNTDLEKLWKHPSRSGFKAKVRVPRLKGGKKGVLATRSPHRPCPIGLTLAKVEGVDGHAVLLSGVDLVDGTPVLDIKPYLPYSDCVSEATTPMWLQDGRSLDVASVRFSEDFSSSLSACWESAGKWSLYSSEDELKDLIKQILSWDIRSISQRKRPHNANSYAPSVIIDETDDGSSVLANAVAYHLFVEGVDVSYQIDEDSNIKVNGASLSDLRQMAVSATWKNMVT